MRRILIFIALFTHTLAMSLHSSRAYSFTRPTILNKEETIDVEEGSNFTLTCQTHANDTHKINFDLSWDVPHGREVKVSSGSAVQLTDDVWSTKLYFTNVSYEDEGMYSCTLKIGKLAQFNDSVILRVKPTNRHEDVKAIFSEAITNDIGEGLPQFATVSPVDFKKIVSEVKLPPQTSQQEKTNVPMFSKSELMVKYGMLANVTCKVPEDHETDVTFSYKPCRSKNCRKDSETEIKGKGTKITRHNISFHTVETEFYKSGDLFCIAKNAQGEWKSSQHICVTESPEGLSISEPDYHGNLVSVTCQMSSCEYTGWPQWYYRPINKTMIVLQAEYTQGVPYTYATATIANLTSENAGVYVCMAKTQNGGVDSVDVTLEPLHMPQQYTLVLSLSLTVLTALAAGSMYLVIRCNRRNTKTEDNDLEMKGKPSEDFEVSALDKKWIFPASKLKIKRLIGSGYFSHVYQATAEGILPNEAKSNVAVKAATSRNNLRDLWNEFKVMEHVNSHPHIVNLLGVAVDKDDIFLVVEYCRHGSLLAFLRANKGRIISCRDNVTIPASWQSKDTEYTQPKNITLLTSWAYQIARGMDWLSFRNVLHGDLAARNILLSEKNVVKICDFGLARKLQHNQVFQKPQGASVPLKWMALESIESMKFSKQTDVWSFGVVVWEIFSFGESPYADMIGMDSLFEYLSEGKRLKRPGMAPDEIYELMLLCWDADPDDRPSFKLLSHQLSDMLPSGHLAFLEELEEKYIKLNADAASSSSTSSCHDSEPGSEDDQPSSYIISETIDKGRIKGRPPYRRSIEEDSNYDSTYT